MRVHDSTIIGEGRAMQPVFHTLLRLEDVPRPTVLVTGESGTGKELVATAIHRRSPRRGAPLVVVDCTAIPPNLVESELFGHEAGAYTDARSAAPGQLERAGAGTLFLDEVGELPPPAQARLLRVLESRRYRRVGGTREHKLEAAIVAATNRDLDEEVREGRFRPDLFFRLAVVRVHIPPLRERPEDVPALVEHFLALANRTWHRSVRGFSEAAMDVMARHVWAGNVRELRNVVERSVALATEAVIDVHDLPAEVRLGLAPTDPALHDFPLPDRGVDLEEVERDLMVQALHRTGGNKTAAARLLGLSRAAMRYRIRQHGLGAAALAS